MTTIDIDGVQYTVHSEQYLEYVNAAENAKKFWMVRVVEDRGGSFWTYTTWGRIGTAGQAQLKDFVSQTSAASFAEASKEGKLNKGYKLVKGTVQNKPVGKPAKIPVVVVETEWDVL